MKKIWIIKTGQTFSAIGDNLGDFDDWIISAIHTK